MIIVCMPLQLLQVLATMCASKVSYLIFPPSSLQTEAICHLAGGSIEEPCTKFHKSSHHRRLLSANLLDISY